MAEALPPPFSFRPQDFGRPPLQTTSFPQRSMQDSQSALNEALAALAANRPDEAASRLRSQAEQDVENALVHAALGMVLAQMGDASGAIDALDRAHYLQPHNAQVLYHYGLALETTGRARQARLRYEAALRLDPGFDPVRLRLESLIQAEATAPPPAPALAAPSSVVSPPAAAPPLATTPLAPSVPEPAGPRYFGPQPAAARPALPSHGQRTGTRSQPLPELPSRPMQTDTSTWDAPPLPGFGGLCRATLQLWGSQPLLWLGLLVVPNAVAACVPIPPGLGWISALAWSLALALGAAGLLLGMAGQWMEGTPFVGEGRFTADRWGKGTLLSLGYVALIVAPLAAILALRVRVSPAMLVLGSLLLTLPFHALLAPALMLTVTGQQGPGKALRSALSLASRRTWLHLGLLVALTLLAGGLMAAFAWAFVVTLRGSGTIVERTMEVAGVCLGESLWAALLTVAGLDAISTRPPGDLSDDEPDEEERPEPFGGQPGAPYGTAPMPEEEAPQRKPSPTA